MDPQKASRITAWLDAIPPSPSDLQDAFTASIITIAQFHDWFDMQKDAALNVLRTLDKHEHSYRILGRQYHVIPYNLRHSPTHRSRPPIQPRILDHLAGIFEVGAPRKSQPFFNIWYQAQDLGTAALSKIAQSQAEMDLRTLWGMYKQCQESLRIAEKCVKDVENAITPLVRMVEEVFTRVCPISAPAADLGLKFGTEGGLFRRWIFTFDEVQEEVVERRPQKLEMVAMHILTFGVLARGYWSEGRET